MIRGRRALVTGAASGIGRALSLALAREGADLHLVDRNAEGLAASAEAAGRHGVEVRTHVCDLAEADAVAACAEDALARRPDLHLLVNNAGIAYFARADRMPLDRWEHVLAVNLMAPIRLTHRLLPALMAQPEAHVLNVCSIAGLVATRKLAAYTTSKFGLVGFSRALRNDVGPRVGVTALCPSFVDTGIFDASFAARGGPGRKPPPALLATPESVAERALDAIRRNRAVVRVGGLAHALAWLDRLAPGLLRWSLLRGRRRRRRRRSRI